MKKKVLNELKNLRKKGFFSIFLSSVICKALVFVGSTILVRVLSKTEYGIYAYVLNAISMLSLLNDFGASTAALQFLTESHDNKKKQSAFFHYSLKIIFFSSVFSSLLTFLSPLYYPFTITEAKKYVFILGLLPVFSILSNIFPVILRSNLNNKKYAKLQVFSTFSNYLLLISLSLIFGLTGAIISQYAYYIILIIYSIFLTKEYLKNYSRGETLNKKEKSAFLKYSFISQINNSMSGLLLVLDTFLVGLLISKSEAVASYKVASAIPHALTFISTAVAIYITPYFVKNNKNLNWIRENYKKLILYGAIGYGVMCLGIILLSKYIILIVYGKQYLDTVKTFNILMIGLYFISAFKVPCSNILYSLKDLKINLITNASALIINYFSNIYFIKQFGYMGAAITTTLINIFISLVYVIYLNNKLKKGDITND